MNFNIHRFHGPCYTIVQFYALQWVKMSRIHIFQLMDSLEAMAYHKHMQHFGTFQSTRQELRQPSAPSLPDLEIFQLISFCRWMLLSAALEYKVFSREF